MTAASELKSLRERAIDACYNEYKELIATWRNLETKAQGNIAIAGIFIAGAFAYISKASEQPYLPYKILFGAAILLLMLSVFFALQVLRIRTVKLPLLGRRMSYDTQNVSNATDAEYPEYAGRIFDSHSADWADVIVELETQNQQKGEKLRWAQFFLLGAIGLAALLTILKTFNP